MAYLVQVERSVIKTLGRLPRADKKRISRKIDALAKNPRPAGVRKLSAAEDIYRIRAGDYRILYQIKDRELIVLVVSVGHRREVYRK